MAVVYERPQALAGCRHSTTAPAAPTASSTGWSREALDELGIEGKARSASRPVGCAVMAYDYFNCDMMEAAHGRAPAVATGVKRALPDNVVFTYQGDGDLAAIGTAETVHAATRGENITVIFVNNAIYGMTGGQMAPTTLPGQVTQTTPYGRDVKHCRLSRSVSARCSPRWTASAYAERVTVDSVPNVRKARHGDQEGVSEPDGGQGLLHCRGALHLPDQLGPVPRWRRSSGCVTT